MIENIKYRFALDKNNKQISITNAIRGDFFSCPFCGSRMIAKKGEVKIHHFAHLGSCTETWKYDPMTEWHKNWQNEFPKENQEIMLRKGNIKHIADVLINKYVVEFQHSKISLEEFLDRNRFYTSLGYKLIWIFDFVNGQNIRNMELLCTSFEYENEDIFILKELKNILISVDEEYNIEKKDLLNEIKSNTFPKDEKAFNKKAYINSQNKKKIIKQENTLSSNETYYNPPTKQFIFDKQTINHTRSIPSRVDYIDITKETTLKNIIESNRGKNFWVQCVNTGVLYYFENTVKDETMRVWVCYENETNKLDEVHRWKTLLEFKSYRWKTI